MSAKKPKRQPPEWILQEMRRVEELKAQVAAAMTSPLDGTMDSFKRELEEHNKRVERALHPEPIELCAPVKPLPLTREDLREFTEMIKPSKSREKKLVIVILDRKTKSLTLLDHPEVTFSLANAPKRFDLMQLLSEIPCRTEDLAERTDSTVESVRTAIAALNRKISSALKLKSPLIKGSARAGYCINPLYLLRKP